MDGYGTPEVVPVTEDAAIAPESVYAETKATVERMLREHLQDYFEPSLRDCFQVVKVLPPPSLLSTESEPPSSVVRSREIDRPSPVPP